MFIFIFLLFFLLGISSILNYRFFLIILALLAFTPSPVFFTGMNNIFARAGILAWLLYIPFFKSQYNLNRIQLFIFWLVLTISGFIFNTNHDIEIYKSLILIFGHTGFSLLYILLVGFFLYGKYSLSKFINYFIFFGIIFYTIGGILQYLLNELLFLYNDNLINYTDTYYFKEGHRMVGIWSNSSHATATVINIMLSFIFAKQMTNKGSLLNNIYMILCILGLFLCQNRGNIFAMIGVVIIAILSTNKIIKVRQKYFILVISILALLSINTILGEKTYAERILNESNATIRLDFYNNFLTNFPIVFKNYIFGVGFEPLRSIGEGYSKILQAIGLAENQILVWIACYGWLVTIIFIILIYRLLKKFSITFKIYQDWVGLGLIFAWLSLFFCFSVNADQLQLIPLLYILTYIWIEEVKSKKMIKI